MLEYLVFVLFFPNEYFIIIIYIKYVPTRPFCWVFLSVQQCTIIQHIQKVFSASLFPIFLSFSLIPKWIQIIFFPRKILPTTPGAYIYVLHPSAAAWLVWGFDGWSIRKLRQRCTFAFLCRAAEHQPSAPPGRRFSRKALCCADHSSWQPPPPFTQPSSAPGSE